jgi:hypothetical protein
MVPLYQPGTYTLTSKTKSSGFFFFQYLRFSISLSVPLLSGVTRLCTVLYIRGSINLSSFNKIYGFLLSKISRVFVFNSLASGLLLPAFLSPSLQPAAVLLLSFLFLPALFPPDLASFDILSTILQPLSFVLAFSLFSCSVSSLIFDSPASGFLFLSWCFAAFSLLSCSFFSLNTPVLVFFPLSWCRLISFSLVSCSFLT